MKASMTACQREEVQFNNLMSSTAHYLLRFLQLETYNIFTVLFIIIVEYFYKTHLEIDCDGGVCSDLVAVRPDQTVDVIVACRLRVWVTVFSQSFAGVPVAGQTFLIQVNMNGRVQLKIKHTEDTTELNKFCRTVTLCRQ